MPADACIMHGNNKSTAELRMAITEGVRHVVVDSFDELDRLDALHTEGVGPSPDVLVRITPGVHAHTHEFIATGQDDSKFGFNLANGDALRAVRRAEESPSVRLVGLHCHIGSNVFAASSFGKAAEVMAEFAQPLGLPELVLGGGLGVAYVESEEAPTLTQWGYVLRDACDSLGVTARVSVEPGRSIVAAAALTVYTLGTIKRIPGVRTYLSVDGGMSDNPRPVLYGSGYESFLPRSPFADRTLHGRLVGKHCESGDVLLFDAKLPTDARGGRSARDTGHGGLRSIHGIELQRDRTPARRVRSRRRRSVGHPTRDVRRPVGHRRRLALRLIAAGRSRRVPSRGGRGRRGRRSHRDRHRRAISRSRRVEWNRRVEREVSVTRSRSKT